MKVHELITELRKHYKNSEVIYTTHDMGDEVGGIIITVDTPSERMEEYMASRGYDDGLVVLTT